MCSEASLNIDPGLEYISKNPQINNVLLTGGDSLILGTKKIPLHSPAVAGNLPM